MQTTQIYEVLNDSMAQYLGEDVVAPLDLTGLVALGQVTLSTMSDGTIGTFMQGMLDRIYKIVIGVRDYTPHLDNIMVDYQTYGAMLEKVYIDPVDAQENGSYALQNGQSIDPFVISLPQSKIKIFAEQSTWEIPYTISKKMLLKKFVNDAEFSAFITGIEMQIRNSFELSLENAKKWVITNFIGEKINYAAQPSAKGLHVVNLLAEYNTAHNTSYTPDVFTRTPDCLRYATYRMLTLKKKMEQFSRCFNIEQCARFTKESDLHFIIQSDFAQSCKTYLESDVYHNELTQLPSYTEIAAWQGTDDDMDYEACQKIDIVTADEHSVTQTGVVGFMFDRDALGVTVFDQDTTSQYNGRGEYTNYWNKANVGKFNDLTENGLVFIVANA